MRNKSTPRSIAIGAVQQLSVGTQYLIWLFLVASAWFSGLAFGAKETPITQPSGEGQFVTTTPTNRAMAELKLRQLKQALSKNNYHADHILDRIEILQKQLHGER